ncbi:MAG: ABC transporter ATP-binding protein/permease, partial [Solobacterium sp.]|nr:ABC transporter ATP-binding protein/permease [Solobacterium sp.]
SFKTQKGTTTAFIGSTGSGKSTLINLIPRLFDCTGGAVLVDGVNVKDYTQEDLHNRIGFIPQKATLFSGTVTSNVTYGDNGKAADTKEDVENAIEVSQSSDFVSKMDGQLDARIAQGGTNVSGGQKQRLTIARAIARKPEILVFDDSFSALDYKTDHALRKALDEKEKETTKIIVAQRIGTIRHADQIIVLDHGKAVGIGTHDELMKNCPVYQEIASSQLSKEELADA